MTTRFAYDASVDPPAPVFPIQVSTPAGDQGVMLAMLVDTGADCTLLPAPVVRSLRLPQIDVISLSGVGGTKQRATVHAARVKLADLHLLVRVVAFADEAILGRDLLNQAVMMLDGPGLAITVRPRSRKPRRARST